MYVTSGNNSENICVGRYGISHPCQRKILEIAAMLVYIVMILSFVTILNKEKQFNLGIFGKDV
jgi:hypothetical protein